jgi:hypothetical protein
MSPANDPKAELRDERLHVEGARQGSPIAISLGAERLSWREGEAEHESPLSSIAELKVVAPGMKKALEVAGAAGLALGALWLVGNAARAPAALAAMAVGALLLAVGTAWPRCSLALKIDGTALEVALRGRRACAEARLMARFAHRAAPALRARSRSVLGFLGGELSALFSSRRGMRWEYRAIAGAASDPQTEERFVRARRRLALWNLWWVVLAPVTIAMLQQLLVPPESASWAYARIVIVLLVGGFVGLRLLPRLEPLLKRWIGV